MTKKIIYLFLLIPALFSCNYDNKNKQEQDLDCEEIISKIVQSSSLDWKHYPEAFTRIDRISGDSIFIKVFFDMDITDQPNTHQVAENTIAWLLLCVKEKELYNITFNTQNPIALRFDKKLLKADNIEKLCQKSNEKMYVSESENRNNIKINTNPIDKKYHAQWQCFKYVKDVANTDTENQIFSENYAKQFSHFAQFSLKKDSLILPNQCAKYVFQYKYPTKLKPDNKGDIVILNPKQDSISIIKGFEDDLQCDNIFNTLFLNDSTIIFRDRGYFFYFKKKNNNDFISKNFHIEGIPSDDRNYWKVQGEYNFINLQHAYNSFLTDFPYASENLLEKIPLKSFYDNKHYINYIVQKNSITIEKEVPLGIVSISLKKKNNVCVLSYEIKYPQE